MSFLPISNVTPIKVHQMAGQDREEDPRIGHYYNSILKLDARATVVEVNFWIFAFIITFFIQSVSGCKDKIVIQNTSVCHNGTTPLALLIYGLWISLV